MSDTSRRPRALTSVRVRHAVPAAFAAVWLGLAGMLIYDLAKSGLSGYRFHRAGIGLAILFCLYVVYAARSSSRRAAKSAYRMLHNVDRLTDQALSQLPLPQLLEELLTRTREVASAQAAAVLLLDGADLVVHAHQGLDPVEPGAVRLPLGIGLAGLVAELGTPLQKSDLAPADIVMAPLHDFASAAAVPLVAEGRLIGALLVAKDRQRSFADADIRLLEIVGQRVASAIERRRLSDAERVSQLGAGHARSHLGLLVDGSRILMQSIDEYEPALAALVDLAVPSFADYAAMYLVDDAGRLRRHAARHADSRFDQKLVELAAAEGLDGDLLTPVRDVMASGDPSLVIQVLPSDAPPEERPFRQSLAALDLTSYVLVPIQVRGLAFGTIVMGTAGSRRGYRPSDLNAAQELANRAALAIERTLLYREACRSADLSNRHARRLRSLLEAWLSIGANLSPADICRIAVERARRTVEASSAYLAHRTPDGWQVSASHGDRAGIIPSDDVWDYLLSIGHGCWVGMPGLPTPPPAVAMTLLEDWIATPLPTGPGVPGGVILLLGPAAGAFSAEDESLLGLLAQMVAVSLVNTTLLEATRNSETRLGALLDATPAAIVEVGSDGSIRSWNPAAGAMFGWASAAVVEAAFEVDVQAAVCKLGEQARLRGRAVSTEVTALGRDGNVRRLSLSVGPSVDTGLVVVATDETERHRLSEQVQQAQRLEAVGRLAGGMAHDFGNLLTVILGYAESMLRKLDDADPMRDRVAAIQRAGTRGADLTRQLLTISRRQVVNPVLLRPADVINEFADMLRRLAGDAVQLQVFDREGSAAVRFDRGQFEQVLLNLVANARDAMPDGGHITIETRLVDPEDPLLEGPQANGRPHLGVVVRDQGLGMDAHTLAHCLEPFFTTKSSDRGTGLGLASVYGIVTQSGGRVHVRSSPGRGTSVTLLLPVATADDESDPAQPGSSATGGQEGAHILVVDDEPEVRALVRHVLEECGHIVLEAASGPRALGLLADYSGPLDLVLTDVVMPHMRGPELVQRIQLTRDVAVLYMSGYVDRIDDLGAVDVLAKPFRPEELARRVQTILATAGSGSRPPEPSGPTPGDPGPFRSSSGSGAHVLSLSLDLATPSMTPTPARGSALG